MYTKKRSVKRNRMSKRRRMRGGGSYGVAANAGKFGYEESLTGGMKSSAKKSYRKRVKSSRCRGLMASKCRSSKSCKMAFGKKRSYCRKSRILNVCKY